MADPEHLEILHKGVDAWNTWRKKHPEVVPSLNLTDLSDTCFSRLDFKGVDLSRADLSGSDLSCADIGGSNFSAANLAFADLSRADCSCSHFIGANLSCARLSYVDLSNADLSDSDLSNASFNHANLSDSFLSGANLRNAFLLDADIRGANLLNANLSGAKLIRTNLSSAQLIATKFDHANLFGCAFVNVDLSECCGLDKVEHEGPSSIGIDTIFTSKGKIPDVFLRGAGVPEEFIQYAASLLGKPFEFYSCFISYSHQDQAFARLLHDRLQGRGIRCWLDEHQLLPGDDIHATIDRGIQLWDKVLFCASEASLKSWWVDGEINRAFQKEAQLMKERGKKVLALIPLNLDNYLFSPKCHNGKKAEITSRVAANFVGWEKNHDLFTRELEKVIRALKTIDTGREPPPTPKLGKHSPSSSEF